MSPITPAYVTMQSGGKVIISFKEECFSNFYLIDNNEAKGYVYLGSSNTSFEEVQEYIKTCPNKKIRKLVLNAKYKKPTQ